jgi:hypothetical protein
MPGLVGIVAIDSVSWGGSDGGMRQLFVTPTLTRSPVFYSTAGWLRTWAKNGSTRRKFCDRFSFFKKFSIKLYLNAFER